MGEVYVNTRVGKPFPEGGFPNRNYGLKRL